MPCNVKHHFPVIERREGDKTDANTRWSWVTFTASTGNKYEALELYKAARKALGVLVVAWDMSQADSQFV